MITIPMINVQTEIIISLTAPAGRSFSLDMIRPPVKPPIAPANDDDSAVQQRSSNNLTIRNQYLFGMFIFIIKYVKIRHN